MIIVPKENMNDLIIELNKDELLMLHAALNETCNGLDIDDFDTRVGFKKENLLSLLEKTRTFIFNNQ